VKEFLERVSRWLLIGWLVFLPTQLGKHFWPEWSYVLGIRVDYLSPTLYFGDLLWVGWWLGSRADHKWRNKLSFGKGLVIMFVAVNIIIASSRWLALYRWLRWGQWWLTLEYFWRHRERVKEILLRVIPVWLIVETLLGIMQLMKGGSLEGGWYLLGERRFSLTTVGTAQMSILGRGLIRAYGTFSHPNSLAGFLLISLLFWTRWKKEVRKLWWWIIWWMGVVGIMVSGSRMIWLLTLAVIMVEIYRNYKDKREMAGMMMILVGLFSMVLALVGVNYRTSDFMGGWDKEGLEKRMSLNLAAIKMIKSNPLFGVGMGNFLEKLPEFQKENRYFWLQPAHNIMLLELAEIGLLGIVGVGVWLGLAWEKMRLGKADWMILGVVMLTGLADHYWMTLPQNWWLLAVAVGMWGLERRSKG
jgi:hypothetical protein